MVTLYIVEMFELFHSIFVTKNVNVACQCHPLTQWYSPLEPRRPTKDEHEHFGGHYCILPKSFFFWSHSQIHLSSNELIWLLLEVFAAENS